jgi:4a-hydroxytetrahydrobiopterin dehydratase
MPPTKLTEAEIADALDALGGDWERQGDSIVCNYAFKDFAAALAFVNQVGELAEAADHHPDILLHGWNKVRITLSTHSAKGLTQNDFSLARKIDGLLR